MRAENTASWVVDGGGAVWRTEDTRLLRGDEVVFEGKSEAARVLVDREGCVWLGTRSEGLYRFTPSVLRSEPSSPGTQALNLYSLYEGTDGAMWYAAYGGGAGVIRNGVPVGLPGPLLAKAFALCVAGLRDGRILAGTYKGGLWSVGERSMIPFATEHIGKNDDVWLIHEDRGGALWIGTQQGLWRNSGREWKLYGIDSGLASAWVRTCLERRGGELWFGTQGGGIAIWRGGRFESIGAAQKLASNSVRGLFEDDRGIVWVGTEGQGLARIELAEGAPAARARVAHIRASDGLYDDVVHAVLADDSGELWGSTNRGLFRVTRSALDAFAEGRTPRVICASYTEDDGMPNREANGGAQGAAIRTRDGRLWFATQQGAVVVDPSQARRTLPPPPTVIEELTARGVRISGRRGEAELPADRRDFSIAYAGLSLRASRDLRFRYRLLPGSREWTEAGDRRTAYFTHIPAGRHTFEVTTSLPDADWNGPVARMTIHVAPRLWETWWFTGSIAALAALAGLGALRLRERRLLARQRELASQVESATRELVREKHETEQARLEAERSRDVAQRSLGTIETQAQELRELNDARTRFFANVSHEFRTPLTLTIGPLEDVLSGQHGEVGGDTRPSLEMALRNSHRALRQVNQLLDMARFEAGGTRLLVRVLNLNELASDVVRAFAPLADRRGVRLELLPDPGADAPSPRARLHGDPALLEQVFANLISNALRHTGTGGSVRIGIHADHPDSAAPFVHVRVRDTGEGIAPEDLEHIFERFYQAEGARTQGFPSTGIGLSLTQDIVHLHGGRIDVESAPGEGSSFTVSLPLGSAHLSPEQLGGAGPVVPRPAAAPSVVAPDWRRELDAALSALEGGGGVPRAEDSAGDVPGEQTTVLVVEDDAEVRGYLCQHLRPQFRVIEAVDGIEGLAAVREHTPDLVVSDVMMPRMDGHALCRAIKEDPDTDFVPVVLLTARASVEHRIEGLEGGADDYLAKPFHSRELLARVNNLLTLRRRLRERLAAAEPSAPTGPATAAPALLRPSAVEVASTDEQFLNRLRAVVESRLGDEDFGVQSLADAMAMDRSSLYRRLSETSGEGIEAMLRRFRLERAAQLLEARSGNVGEIAYAVGFKSVSHFCKTFRDRFGVTPGAWANGKREG
ncbi:MAG: response regulator [Candidatus Eisenbacteria bacterium]|nr:response regulator [Candidatus Eisenbacteria bacterium]